MKRIFFMFVLLILFLSGCKPVEEKTTLNDLITGEYTVQYSSPDEHGNFDETYSLGKLNLADGEYDFSVEIGKFEIPEHVYERLSFLNNPTGEYTILILSPSISLDMPVEEMDFGDHDFLYIGYIHLDPGGEESGSSYLIRIDKTKKTVSLVEWVSALYFWSISKPYE